MFLRIAQWPDLRSSESSTLCTSPAFQIFRSIRLAPEDVLVSSGIKFLLDALNKETGHWRIIPAAAELSPHAPWWNQADRTGVFDHFSLNPTAEILGYLYDCQKYVSSGTLSLVSDRVLSHLSDLKKIEMHELLCCLRLLRTEALPESDRSWIQKKLSQLVEGTIECDPTKWEAYCLRPLQVADDPQSPFIVGIEDAVAANLDYEISSQNEEGSWTPTWTWGDAYPEDWKKAQLEWAGVITLEKLLLLKRFNRIEEVD